LTGLSEKKFRNDLNENAGAKALKLQGATMDSINAKAINGNVYRRVLYGAALPSDIPSDISNPRVLFNSLSEFARNVRFFHMK